MCAICGLFCVDDAPVDPERLTRARDVMTVRGPDDAGLAIGRGFGLAHRRLSILDLSSAGHQPMEFDDANIVFNGEIYNFLELRAELEAAGRTFATRTDTEVILVGFREWGLERLLGRLRGMFAFAIVDRRAHALHLARDPFGKKPLYFRCDGRALAFASSLRALVRLLTESPTVDVTAVDALVANLYVPGPGTIFRGVEKLPPGTWLTIDRSGRRTQGTHHRPHFNGVDDSLAETEWVDRVEDGLRRAVERRLIADVPVGVLLSGGVDSGLVTSFAAEAQRGIQTFTVRSETDALDESPIAEAVARRYGTRHVTLSVGAGDATKIEPLVAAMGEPLADASALNVYAIAQKAREQVKVLLTGDGGDEAFGGYTTFWAYRHADTLARFVPQLPATTALATRMRRLPSPISRAGTLLYYASQPPERTWAETAWIADAPRRALFRDDVARELPTSATDHVRAALRAARGSRVRRVMDAHLRTILVDDYLAKIDVGTMAASVEARSPFLDRDLFELAAAIPDRVRFSRGQRKAVLRRLAGRRLPDEVVHGKKRGFVAPVSRWLSSSWRPLVDEYVLGAVERRGWFRRDAVEAAVRRQREGTGEPYLVWTLLVLEMWLRQTLEQPS